MSESSTGVDGANHAKPQVHVVVRTRKGEKVLTGHIISSVTATGETVFEPRDKTYGRLEVHQTDYWDEEYTVCDRSGRRVGECLSCVVGTDILQ